MRPAEPAQYAKVEEGDKMMTLGPQDTEALKRLLQYAFADSPTFEGLTETERAILGNSERFKRIVEWSCNGKEELK